MANMLALTFDRSREDWATSRGLVKERVPVPQLIEPERGIDRSKCIIEVLYSGFCGSDRGIWWRHAFGDMILDSLDEEGADKRIIGHELLGRVVEVGKRVSEKYRLKPGDIVTTESHIICGTCYQCRMGDTHVCARDKIIGISQDGCFADYIKLPAKALWRTDLDRIRPEVAAVQEPFGNAVHACQITDLRGKTVAILGCGTIGLFAVLVARGLGAAKIVGIEVKPHHAEMALQLGADMVLTPDISDPTGADPGLVEQVFDLTKGVGVDVALEMAGFNNSLNNAIRITRRGGTVVAFGVHNGPVIVDDFHRVVMNGLQIQGVVGRRIFETWGITRNLLEGNTGIQDAIWKVILNEGRGTMVDSRDWEMASFETMIRDNPKAIIRWAGV